MMIHLENTIRVLTFFLLFTTSLTTPKNRPRKQRSLHFPDKTNVVLTISLLKLFPSESILNTLTEYDVLFPVPLHPYKLPNKRLRRQVERSIIHQKFETISNLIGLDGEYSLGDFICTIKNSFRNGDNLEDNLVRDIFTILFNLKNGSEHCRL